MNKFEQQVLETALGYAERGWPVLPLIGNSKLPATPHGSKDASTDPAEIKRRFSGVPMANVGIATGRTAEGGGVTVLDIDTKETRLPSGAVMTAEKIERYLLKAGLLNGVIAVTRTRSGGKHYYYRADDQPNSAKVCGLSLDVRGVSGYCVAPCSRIDNQSYEWLDVGTRGTPDEIRAGLPIRHIRNLFAGNVPDVVKKGASKSSAYSPGAGALAAFVLQLQTGERHPGTLWALARCAEAEGDPQEILDAAVEIGIPERDLERAWAWAQKAAGI